MSARQAVEDAFSRPAEHVDSVLVVERTGDFTIWEGVVEVFIFSEPPHDKIFTWVAMGKHGPEWVIVSATNESPSPALAVRKWLHEHPT